jgi:hypothetical protein
MLESHREYIKYRQKQLKERIQRAAEEEAAEEAARIAKQEAIAEQERVLLEQQEYERLCREDAQRKEKLTEQKWNSQLNTLIAQIREDSQKDDKIEEIRVIIQNREPSLQELDWDIWLSDPLNQRLADLDFGQAMEMFKRDNLMAKRRRRRGGQSKVGNWALSFTGNGSSGAEDYVTTDFNPDDYDLNLGCTVSYWVRPDEVGNTMFAFGRKHSGTQRFVFGINRKRQGYFALGQNKLTTAWVNMDTPVEESLLEEDGSYWNLKTDGTWYHFVVTYDDRSDTSSGADRKLYVNGVLRHTNSINWSATGGGTGGMYFGARNISDSYNNGWACGLDEVAIFNTAKDSDWVTSVYNTDMNKLDLSNERGLVGYWKFNEGNGTTVKDHSGNGNHGTFAAISGDTTAFPTWEKRGLRKRRRS